MAMRVGLIVSVAAHVAIIAWGFISLPWPKPIDASDIEQIPVDFVTIADDTKITKGLKTADVVADKPTPPPPADKAEDAPPLPKPSPQPDPTPAPPPPPPPPPDPTPPPPTPQPDPTPPPPQDTPPAPSPDATAPPPPDPTPTPPQPLKDVPLPHIRPTPPKPKPPSPTPPQDNTQQEMDQIATLLDQSKPAPSTTDTTPPTDDKQTVGSVTGLDAPTLTASELDALKSKILSCFHPPPGWADSQDGDVVLMLDLNQDGTLSDAPSVVQTPQGQYSNTATESASRAVRLCQPYDMLSADKYDVWKQVRVVFKPSDVGGA